MGHSMGNCVFGAYTNSEDPDHPVHRTVWLQHSLSAYSIFDRIHPYILFNIKPY